VTPVKEENHKSNAKCEGREGGERKGDVKGGGGKDGDRKGGKSKMEVIHAEGRKCKDETTTMEKDW
jgi:hypothetical protein